MCINLLLFPFSSHSVFPNVEKFTHLCNHQILVIVIFFHLKRNSTSNQKLACFALYLKIVNTFLQNDVRLLKQIVQGT